MSASDWTMQFLADMLNAQVDRPEIFETTALGAGYLAGWQAGLYPAARSCSPRAGAATASSPRHGRRPNAGAGCTAGWRDAVRRAL